MTGVQTCALPISASSSPSSSSSSSFFLFPFSLCFCFPVFGTKPTSSVTEIQGAVIFCTTYTDSICRLGQTVSTNIATPVPVQSRVRCRGQDAGSCRCAKRHGPSGGCWLQATLGPTWAAHVMPEGGAAAWMDRRLLVVARRLLLQTRRHHTVERTLSCRGRIPLLAEMGWYGIRQRSAGLHGSLHTSERPSLGARTPGTRDVSRPGQPRIGQSSGRCPNSRGTASIPAEAAQQLQFLS